jgi:hypothetical protein
VLVLRIVALSGDPKLEVEVDTSGVAEGLGAPRTESLAAAHRARSRTRPLGITRAAHQAVLR